ncbi:hypothetical protein EH221_02055 [bacterium]|nr:MAG: hypothetical protein EH221_02055 [bacterium]
MTNSFLNMIMQCLIIFVVAITSGCGKSVFARKESSRSIENRSIENIASSNTSASDDDTSSGDVYQRGEKVDDENCDYDAYSNKPLCSDYAGFNMGKQPNHEGVMELGECAHVEIDSPVGKDEAISNFIRSNIASFRLCYLKILWMDKSAQGDALLQFENSRFFFHGLADEIKAMEECLSEVCSQLSSKYSGKGEIASFEFIFSSDCK